MTAETTTERGAAARRLPPWIRVRLRAGDGRAARVRSVLGALRLHTVCQSADCPNRHECFACGTATFMILGDTCTRDCAFCAVPHGRPSPPDPGESLRVARAARRLGLRHVVVTSVTRDDLEDGGAGAFAATVRAVREQVPAATIEVLTPDFQGRRAAVATVLASRPDVFNHNLETVKRLQTAIRPRASYERSLAVLRQAATAAGGTVVKSGLMLGLGEARADVRAAMSDLLAAGCRVLTLGQYLAPSAGHRPVSRYVPPPEFEAYAREALGLGFRAAAAGPLVRSSYRALELLAQARSG